MTDDYITKVCTPSKVSGKGQLQSIDLPDLFDPETGKFLGDPVTPEQQEFWESVLAYLPESYLQQR